MKKLRFKKIILILLLSTVVSSSSYNKIKTTSFYYLDGLIPSDINLNEFISEFDYIDKIKHYKQQQVNNNIFSSAKSEQPTSSLNVIFPLVFQIFAYI